MSAITGRSNLFFLFYFVFCVFYVPVSCDCPSNQSQQCSTYYCANQVNESCSNIKSVNCTIRTTEGCGSLQTVVWPTVENKPKAVRVLYIEVSRISRQVAALRLAFELPGGDYLNSVKAVSVRVTGLNDVDGDSNSLYTNFKACPACQLFDFKDIVTTICQREKPPTFESSCFKNVAPGGEYKVTFTAYPLNVSLEYFVILPNLTSVFDPLTIDDWRSVLSTSVNDSTVRVLFQRAPDKFKVQEYKVSLVNALDDVFRHNVLQSKTNFIVYQNIAPGKYYITVQAVSVNCTSKQCPKVSSKYFKVLPKHDTVTSFPTVILKSQVLQTTDNQAPVTSTLPSHQQEYIQSVTLIVGTVGGTFLVIAIVIISIACYCRRKHRFDGGFQMQRLENTPNDTPDIEYKQLTRVLLLYSYDCPPHEKVVQAFALYLKEIYNCNVRLDVWHQNEVQERGSHEWVGQELEYADIVIVVCSAGARFKCSRHRQKYRLKHDQGMTDIFRRAIEMVSQRMWYTVNHSDFIRDIKFAAVYFPYCTESDIPHKLDKASKFALMRDIASLNSLFYSDANGSVMSTTTDENTYMLTDQGSELHSAILEAEEYFRQNPNWFHEIMDVRHRQSERSAKDKQTTDSNKESIEQLKESSVVNGDCVQDNVNRDNSSSPRVDGFRRTHTPDGSETVPEPSLDSDVPANHGNQDMPNTVHTHVKHNGKNNKKREPKFLDDADDLSQEQFDKDVSFIRNFDEELQKRSTQNLFQSSPVQSMWSNGHLPSSHESVRLEPRFSTPNQHVLTFEDNFDDSHQYDYELKMPGPNGDSVLVPNIL